MLWYIAKHAIHKRSGYIGRHIYRSPFLNSLSLPLSSLILILPFLTFRLLRFLRFPLQGYLPLPPLIIRLRMLELRRRPSTSRLLTILHPLVSLLPEI